MRTLRRIAFGGEARGDQRVDDEESHQRPEADRGVAALVRILGFAVQAAADDNALMNIGQYLIPIAGAWWGFGQVFRNPVRRAPQRRVAAGAPA